MMTAMTTFGIVLVGLIMIVGLIGVLVPIIPGMVLILGAALWWAIGDGGDAPHWIAFAVILAICAAGTVLKYVVPARKTSQAGATTSSMIFAVILGVVGFFVIPIVGAPIGFVLGIYLAELRRQRDRSAAWTSTKAALRGVLLSVLIEFTAAALAVGAWVIAELTI